MIDWDKLQEFTDRLADRYTAAELVELIDPPVQDVIEYWWEEILENEVICGQLSLMG